MFNNLVNALFRWRIVKPKPIELELEKGWVLRHPLCLLVITTIMAGLVLLYVIIASNPSLRSAYWLSQVETFTALNTTFAGQTRFWKNASNLGDAAVLLPLLSFFILTHPRIWSAFFGALPPSVLLVHGGKWVTEVPRPAAVLDTDTFTVIGATLSAHNSLPSGHSATVFVASTIVLLGTRPRTRPFKLGFFILVFGCTCIAAFSRVVVGAHWPIDVLLGALCGIAGGVCGWLLTYRFHRWWQWILKTHGQLWIAVGLLCSATATLPMVSTGAAAQPMVDLAAPCVSMGVGFILLVRSCRRSSFAIKQVRLTVNFRYPSIRFHNTD